MDICVISTNWTGTGTEADPRRLAALDILNDPFSASDVTGQQHLMPSPNVVVVACLVSSADRAAIDAHIDHTLELWETYDDSTYGSWTSQLEVMLNAAS